MVLAGNPTMASSGASCQGSKVEGYVLFREFFEVSIRVLYAAISMTFPSFPNKPGK